MTDNKINSYSRRKFFKVTTVAGGGLVLGFSWLASCKNPEKPEEKLVMPEEWVEMSAFIKIGDNGVVTIASPNPEIGQNVKTSMPMIVAEELGVDWKNVVVEQAGLNSDAFARQVAGGSQSIREGWVSLREAGAKVRTMLVMAAAAAWETEPENCTVENGFVYGPNDQKLGFGELASEAAKLEIPAKVDLKSKEEYTIIGKPKGNVDMDKIITGKPLFGIDTKREGMQYACVMRPPAFGNKLSSFNDEKARKVTGVNDVFQFGDKIAVIASNTWAAMKGKKLLEAEYSEGSTLESTNFHNEELTKLLDQEDVEAMRNDGDVKTAFAEADEVLTRVYESPFLPHNCMEPMNFYADVREDEVELYGPIQTPSWTRSRVSKLLERPEEEINVGMSRMGGGFGRRLYGDFCEEAAEISHLAKTPIQLVFTREDDMMAGTYRPAIKYKIEASIKDGSITGYQLSEAAVNSNMYGLIPNFFPAGAIPNLRVSGKNYQSNITTGAWRAPYTNFLAFAEQSFFDELAEKMGKDEVELRLELLENAKVLAESDERIQYSPGRMQECIKLVTDKANWGNAAEGVYQGISAYYSHNTHVAEIAEVVMENGAPKVAKVYCAVDCGIVINPEGAINQIEGGIIDGVGHAMFGNLEFDNGKPSSSNFDTYRLIRNSEAPDVEVYFVESNEDPTGLGEPSLPPAGGAVANAIYKATGKRMYKQPFVQHEEILG